MAAHLHPIGPHDRAAGCAHEHGGRPTVAARAALAGPAPASLLRASAGARLAAAAAAMTAIWAGVLWAVS
jgi:hypothetical protein